MKKFNPRWIRLYPYLGAGFAGAAYAGAALAVALTTGRDKIFYVDALHLSNFEFAVSWEDYKAFYDKPGFSLEQINELISSTSQNKQQVQLPDNTISINLSDPVIGKKSPPSTKNPEKIVIPLTLVINSEQNERTEIAIYLRLNVQSKKNATYISEYRQTLDSIEWLDENTTYNVNSSDYDVYMSAIPTIDSLNRLFNLTHGP